MTLAFSINVNELFTFRPLFKIGPLGVTWPHVLLFMMTLGLIAFFNGAFRKPQLVPEGAQNAAEWCFDFVREQIVLPVLGPEGANWTGFLAAMFFFVFLLNILEVIPAVQFPITSLAGVPTILAIGVWFIFNGIGIRNQGFVGYFKGIMFPPGVPKPIYVILAPIELFSTVIVRPITLALRLMANMMAGHILLTVMFLGTWIFLTGTNIIGKVGFVAPFGLGVILTAFEIFVAGMQAFIITILTAVYIAGAEHPEH